MNAHRIYLGRKVTCLLFGLTLIWSCGDGPTQVDVQGSNDLPDTIISQKTLTKVPLTTDSGGALVGQDLFVYKIEFSGTDLDGKLDGFSVQVDGGAWSEFSVKTTSSDTLSFASASAEHTVSVRSRDEQGGVDPTPASTVFNVVEAQANAAPTTAFDVAPSNGATTGAGLQFAFGGSDEDGTVVSLIYSLDGATDITLAADADGKASVEFTVTGGNLLSAGSHSFSVRSVDNFGMEDPTPETRSFLVASGFKPLITQTGGPPDGGGWFTGAGIPFAWSSAVSHYSGTVAFHEWSIDDPNTFTELSGSSFTLDPQSAGAHTFRLRAIDLEGNVSDQLTVNFDVAAFVPTEGTLFIDNVSFNPNDEVYIETAEDPNAQTNMNEQILGGFFKNFSKVDVWDVDFQSGGDRYAPAINGSVRLPGPADLAKYSSVVIMTDGGGNSGEEPYLLNALWAAYFQAGGNLFICGYRISFYDDPLYDVTGLSGVSSGRGTDLASVEGFGGEAYSFLSGADVVPVIPGVSRNWERPSRGSAPLRATYVLFGNVEEGGDRQGSRIGSEWQGPNGNYGIWLGVSLFYLDQSSSGIVAMGDFIMGDRFGEAKN